MTSFREKLKEIRASEADRSRSRIPLSDHQLGLDQPAEKFLSARGDLVKDLERLMTEFIAESPMFEIGHGFFEGKYVLSLSCDEPLLDEQRGGMRKHFTRINFLLDPCAMDGAFSITTKLTIRDRDLQKGVIEGNLGNANDLVAFLKFGEEQMLRFATEYFAGRVHVAQTVHPTT
ncbi:MAG: hypothetical protein EXS13_03525 [Planctomycetes bacterium]|nr:hypothetical protein [Planctomycetota bacterium]